MSPGPPATGRSRHDLLGFAESFREQAMFTADTPLAGRASSREIASWLTSELGVDVDGTRVTADSPELVIRGDDGLGIPVELTDTAGRPIACIDVEIRRNPPGHDEPVARLEGRLHEETMIGLDVLLRGFRVGAEPLLPDQGIRLILGDKPRG